jgi:putative DNA primase/helicase
MSDHLTSELPGILTWAVQGCLAWRRERLNIPAALKAAKTEYREESDVLGDFLEEETEKRGNYLAPSGALYQAYREWATGNGFAPLDNRKFKARMQSRGFELKSRKTGNVWLGLRLIPAPTPTVIGGNPARTKNPFGKPA